MLYSELYQRCSAVDNIPVSKRYSVLRFMDAITSLEGVPASQEVNIALLKWVDGEQDFMTGYKAVLTKYNLG